MSPQAKANLWGRIECLLDTQLPRWKSHIEHFGQVGAIKKRQSGKRWADDEVQEALVKAVLSSNTDWSKIEAVLPELCELFCDFSLTYYAQCAETDVEKRLIPRFKARRAASMTLGKDLKNLIKTSQKLKQWSEHHGSAEHYFTQLLARCGNDVKQVALEIGLPQSKFKLPALGVPLAAEALRNMGFDLAKPDRHILRAAGSFGFIRFQKWTDPSGNRPPTPSPSEMYATMATFDSFAAAVNQTTTFVDNAIWLICARSGLGLSNAQLRELSKF